MKEKFLKLKEENPDYSLDQLLYHTYQSLGTDLPFEQIKIDILNDLEIDIEVDGGINKETAILVKDAGANILVSGKYITESDNFKDSIESLKN